MRKTKASQNASHMNSELKKLLAKKQRKPSFQECLIFSELGPSLILVQALWASPSPQHHPSPQMLPRWLKAQVMLGPPVGQHKFNGMLESSNQNSIIINLIKFVSNPTAGTKKPVLN